MRQHTSRTRNRFCCSESEVQGSAWKYGLRTPLPGNFGRIKIEANKGIDLLRCERCRVCFIHPQTLGKKRIQTQIRGLSATLRKKLSYCVYGFIISQFKAIS